MPVLECRPDPGIEPQAVTLDRRPVEPGGAHLQLDLVAQVRGRQFRARLGEAVVQRMNVAEPVCILVIENRPCRYHQGRGREYRLLISASTVAK